MSLRELQEKEKKLIFGVGALSNRRLVVVIEEVDSAGQVQRQEMPHGCHSRLKAIWMRAWWFC